MKKIVVLILLFWISFIPFISVSAQINVPLPGVNCGIANDTTSNISDYETRTSGRDKTVVNQCCTSIQNTAGMADMIGGVYKFKEGNPAFDLIGGLFTNIPGIGIIFSALSEGMHQAQLQFDNFQEFKKNNPDVACVFGEPNTAPTDSSCICISKDSSSANKPLAQMCYTYLSKSKSNELGSCVSCAASGGVWTAIGCIPTNFQTFVSNFLLSIGIGLGGVVALLCIIYSAFMMQTSQGNPEKIKKAQENLTSCILGLMLIIFSVFIMRIIGVDILRIPFLTK